MKIEKFIKENRQEILAYISRRIPGVRDTIAELRLWVLNDEGLYRWWKSQR